MWCVSTIQFYSNHYPNTINQLSVERSNQIISKCNAKHPIKVLTRAFNITKEMPETGYNTTYIA